MYIFTDDQYRELKQLQTALEQNNCDTEDARLTLKKILRIDNDWQKAAINYIKSGIK